MFRAIGALLSIYIAFFVYVVNFGETTILEARCDDGILVQINEYSKVKRFFEGSDGNIWIKHGFTSNERIDNIFFTDGTGNQRVLYVSKEAEKPDGFRGYFFGRKEIWFDGEKSIQACY